MIGYGRTAQLSAVSSEALDPLTGRIDAARYEADCFQNANDLRMHGYDWMRPLGVKHTMREEEERQAALREERRAMEEEAAAAAEAADDEAALEDEEMMNAGALEPEDADLDGSVENMDSLDRSSSLSFDNSGRSALHAGLELADSSPRVTPHRHGDAFLQATSTPLIGTPVEVLSSSAQSRSSTNNHLHTASRAIPQSPARVDEEAEAHDLDDDVESGSIGYQSIEMDSS